MPNRWACASARLLFLHVRLFLIAAFLVSTLPLNRPATVEGSEGKGAWCERCWATDTGPQKESDVTGSRKGDKVEEREREQEKEREQIKKGFPRPGQREAQSDSNTGKEGHV